MILESEGSISAIKNPPLTISIGNFTELIRFILLSFFTVKGTQICGRRRLMPASMTIGQQPSSGQIWFVEVKVYVPTSLNNTTLPVAIGVVLPFLNHCTLLYWADTVASTLLRYTT